MRRGGDCHPGISPIPRLHNGAAGGGFRRRCHYVPFAAAFAVVLLGAGMCRHLPAVDFRVLTIKSNGSGCIEIHPEPLFYLDFRSKRRKTQKNKPTAKKRLTNLLLWSIIINCFNMRSMPLSNSSIAQHTAKCKKNFLPVRSGAVFLCGGIKPGQTAQGRRRYNIRQE